MKLPGPDHPITITANPRRIRVSAGGVVIADTTHALTLKEASYPAVQYVPREDANMALLARTERTTHCPYKGDASYYSINAGGKTHRELDLDLRDAVPGHGRDRRPSGVLSGQGDDRGSGVDYPKPSLRGDAQHRTRSGCMSTSIRDSGSSAPRHPGMTETVTATP